MRKLSDIDFITPYAGIMDKNGRRRTALRHHRGRCGVYLIKEDGVIVYVGMSNYCVNKALYRHFQSWSDRTGEHERRTYDGNSDRYTVAIIQTVGKADHLEQELIRGLKPRDNRELYVPDENASVVTVYESAPF